MKKLIIFLLAAITIVSCKKTEEQAETKSTETTYTAKAAILNNQNDSMNYALGLANGAQIAMYQLRETPSNEIIAEFMSALQRGYDGNVEQLSDAAAIGKNIGQLIKQAETTGLAGNPAWAINQPLFFQGLVNALNNDTLVMSIDTALNYFQTQYQASAMANVEPTLGTAIKGTCPSEVCMVELKNFNDSINYAFGYLNGNELVQYVLSDDNTGEMRKELLSYINIGLNSNVKNPQLVAMGEQIGKSIKEQEATGLIGEPSLDTNFELIKQGFVNGLSGYEEQMTGEIANEYIQSTLATIKYGDAKEEGEKFLAENALRDGVITTPSGLQYEVIKMGKGKKPVATSTVKVHYHGTLINGIVFDSSVDRAEPISFGLTQVIPGWTEGLQLMPIGSKFKFYIPYQLGYGAQQAGSIPPYSTLIFEVELLGIE